MTILESCRPVENTVLIYRMCRLNRLLNIPSTTGEPNRSTSNTSDEFEAPKENQNSSDMNSHLPNRDARSTGMARSPRSGLGSTMKSIARLGIVRHSSVKHSIKNYLLIISFSLDCLLSYRTLSFKDTSLDSVCSFSALMWVPFPLGLAKMEKCLFIDYVR